MIDAHRPAWQLPRPATRTRCPGVGATPVKARHGYACPSCGHWWLGQLIAALGHIPTHTIATTQGEPS